MNSYSTSWWSLLLIYRPREDERLSWPCWLTYSGRFTFTHINGYPLAAGPVKSSESSPARDRRFTTEPPNQLGQDTGHHFIMPPHYGGHKHNNISPSWHTTVYKCVYFLLLLTSKVTPQHICWVVSRQCMRIYVHAKIEFCIFQWKIQKKSIGKNYMFIDFARHIYIKQTTRSSLPSNEMRSQVDPLFHTCLKGRTVSNDKGIWWNENSFIIFTLLIEWPS